MRKTAAPVGGRGSRQRRPQKTPIGAAIGGAERLYISSGDAPAAAEDKEPAAAPTRLHVTVLGHFGNAGIIAGGWLYDPGGHVRQIQAEGQDVDLLHEAALLSGPELCETFGVPAWIQPRLGFVLFIPEGGARWENGLTLAFRLDTGATLQRFVGAAGRIAEIHRILESAPVEYALAVAERAFASWRRGEAWTRNLPPLLDRLLEIAHHRVEAHHDARMGVTDALRAGQAGMLITGRLKKNSADPVGEIVLVSLFGRRIVLPATLPTVSRQALSAASAEGEGYAVFVPIDDFRQDERRWFAEIRLDSGSIERIPFICPPAPEPIEGIRAALARVDPAEPDLTRLLEEAVSPAVDALWAEARRVKPTPTEIAYGDRLGEAQVSIIVPLYRRIDLLHHQIARLSNDPELRSGAAVVELLYVLDDPSLTDAFERYCRGIHDVYGVPFRMLCLHRNAGYAGANNAGAAAASGSVLLFLNSDVLPKRAGWVGELLTSYRSIERCGILGCRLLFEDGSIQHAGMRFRKSSVLPGAWENDHPWKGLPTAFDPCRAAARVPAVTGACLMIERALFCELGGWPEEYVLADFEDSDLCLRAYQHGWNVYYTPKVELYHLERQSSAASGEAAWRQNLTFHNMRRQSRAWGAVIPTILDLLASDR